MEPPVARANVEVAINAIEITNAFIATTLNHKQYNTYGNPIEVVLSPPMLHIHDNLFLDEREIEFSMIRAQGSGGQNVNKVSSAVHLRFDVGQSSLPEECKTLLLELSDRRLSKDGVIVIKAQSFRSQEKNRADAIERLLLLIRSALQERALRKPTRPTRASQRRRVQRKSLHGEVKRLRAKVADFH